MLIIITALTLLAEPSFALASASSSLSAQVSSPNPEVRWRGLSRLRRRLLRGQADTDTIQAFLLAGLETDHSLRMTVGILPPPPRDALPQLIVAMSDARPAVRAQAVLGIAGVETVASGCTGALLRLLNDPVSDVRSAAGLALSRVDADGLAVAPLLAMAEDADAPYRQEALLALNRYGERACVVLPELLSLLRDTDETIRYWVTIVIGNLKDSESLALDVLSRLLREDTSAFVRERAARELWELGTTKRPLPPEALASLLAALDADPSERVREQAAKALGSNRSLRRANQEALQRCIEHDDGVLRDVCRGVLRGDFE